MTKFPAEYYSVEVPINSEDTFALEFTDGTRFYVWSRGTHIEIGLSSVPSPHGVRYYRRLRMDHQSAKQLASTMTRMLESKS